MASYKTNIPASELESFGTQCTFGAEPLAHSGRDDGRTTAQAGPHESPRLDIRQLLNNKDHTWSGIVRDYDDCQELMKQYKTLNDKEGTTDVEVSNDFPEDKQAQKELARQLFEAILEVDPDTSDHMHSQRVQELSNLEVELLSWELLFAIHRAQDGIVGWAKWSPKASQRYQKCGNFQERFALVKEACQKSKSVVHAMLSAPFITRMTAAPTHECKLKSANKMINARKGFMLKGYQHMMAEKNQKSNHDPPASSKRKRGVSGKDEEGQARSQATNYKRHKVEIPRKPATRTVVSSIPGGALSRIPSVPTPLVKEETKKGSLVPREYSTLGLAKESVAGLDQPVASLDHRMPPSGGVDAEYPVPQPNSMASPYPSLAMPLPLPIWEPTETSFSPPPQEMAVGSDTGTEASMVAGSFENLEFLNPWSDFARGDYGGQLWDW
ncbi:uncharacterized protein B0H64DRAFT_447269 [Chaetomium fimeti]|uniref:Uncharacterized protein n=1 Tax=Chaetomium fimeti TaxID=1854472 RepID=A0AAE0H621_9PEZI|nr:hypothetical protein B0H64DRAFT_447269 [Chaetomium fimeti]